MAVDLYMKFEGIDGESTDDAHQGWCELMSLDMGVTNSVSMSSATKGAGEGGRADFQVMTATKGVDSASPDLMMFVANGDKIPSTEVEVCHPEGDKKPLLKFALEDCRLSNYQLSGGGDRPMETFGIAYGKIKFQYIDAEDSKVDRTWNVLKNVKE